MYVLYVHDQMIPSRRPHPHPLLSQQEDEKLYVYVNSLSTIWSDQNQRQRLSFIMMFGLWLRPANPNLVCCHGDVRDHVVSLPSQGSNSKLGSIIP